MIRRIATGRLALFVTELWASETAGGALDHARTAVRELVLPTGCTHLAIRLSDEPLRVFEPSQGEAAEQLGRARELGHAVVGGVRSAFHVRDVSGPSRSVGAMLRPGSARLLFGAPADLLSGRHTALAELWGAGAAQARQRIGEAGSLSEQLRAFESILLARLPAVRGLHPAVAQALVSFAACRADPARVAQVVRESGYSHRGFNALFRGAVGLTPKLFCRVQRFGLALESMQAGESSLASLAALSGYSDQAHFNREFREFAGLTPGRYRALSPAFARHVRLPA